MKTVLPNSPFWGKSRFVNSAWLLYTELSGTFWYVPCSFRKWDAPYYSTPIHLFKYNGNLARKIRLQDTMQCIIYAHSKFDILQGYKNCPCKKERKKQYILRTPKLRFQIIWNWPLSYHSTRVRVPFEMRMEIYLSIL